MQNTRMGHIWVGRAACALLVAAITLYIRFSAPARWQYVLCATVAAMALTVGSLASHAAAEDLSVLSVLPYALHIILASVWFGALPAFLVVCFACTEEEPAAGQSRQQGPPCARASRPQPSSASMPYSNPARQRSRRTPWP